MNDLLEQVKHRLVEFWPALRQSVVDEATDEKKKNSNPVAV